jgi:hypothetical protein
VNTTQGYLHVEAHSAFDAVCKAYGCLIDLGEFAIAHMQPALAAFYHHGRFDPGVLTGSGEWRVPVMVRTDEAGTIPDDARRMLANVGGFLDLRVYPEQGAAHHSGERGGGGRDQQPQHWTVIRAGSTGVEQGRGAHPAVLTDVGG